jgi:cytochrome c peroxidase
MRNACSLGLAPGMIGNPNVIVCGPMGRERGRRSPAETESKRWWLVTIATCAALTSGEANAQSQSLVDQGRRLFFEETFNGNGRTCGTCHPATHNFTIDAAFIARLPDNDPLFVAEFNPNLADLEDPEMMREHGLILENLNGFNSEPVFRGVPHNIGMRASIDADPAHLGPTRDAVGWSGDGAPGAGTIRDFLEGAITQHFPKTLARVPGEDFRLPTTREKRAVEAFMLSLGRQDEFDLEEMSFADADAEAGRRLFLGLDGANRECSFCHHNAGANQADSGLNENFDTGTHDLDPSLPDDDGFGNPGDGTFNTVSLVEAADTPPFFHNNSAETLEQAVEFYTTETFGNSGSGSFGGAFNFGDTEIEQVAAFLRAINAIDNANTAFVVANDARRMRLRADAVEILRVVQSDIEDGIDVLNDSDLAPDAVAEFEAALELAEQAINAPNNGRMNSTISALRRTLRGIPELIAVENVAVANRR